MEIRHKLVIVSNEDWERNKKMNEDKYVKKNQFERNERKKDYFI